MFFSWGIKTAKGEDKKKKKDPQEEALLPI